AVAVAVATVVVVASQMVSRRRVEAEREIARYVTQADRAGGDARSKAAAARDLRARAFAAFDAMDKDQGEALWRETRVLLSAIDGNYDQAERSLETAFMLDDSRPLYRARLADLRREHLLFADDFRLGSKAEVLRERLAIVDGDGSRRKALDAPGTLMLRTTPVATRVTLERYERDPATGRRSPRTLSTVDGARSTTALKPGSYRLVLDGPGLA